MSKTVLVVDDQIGIRLLLEEVIHQEGYNVEVAINGKEALDSITAKQPDLILLDYKLPIIDGPNLLKKLEAQNIFVPTVVMSGLPDKANDEMKAYKSVIKTIGKPFQLNDIREMVNHILK
ncbi:response regulator [Gracilibacillus kekensis]|uniref:Two-component system, response regulator, stage 0 sporulation protein F n=1 Tax=Gracilibacillus kekensis TaxID=1027249 RepID=A0A1M7KC92_9BACI|nr:response regulator [Gracilibacillus kekensis]SHM62903.1 two-component system, response regulator, stage 0 sporulation protein F [Gracilibacillus kekensis]